MPTGIYERTKTYRKTMSKAMRGNANLFGHHHSAETKEKMKKARTGKTYEQIYGIEKATEVRANMSKALKGRTFEDIFGKEQAERLRKNHSVKMKGLISWNKGLTADTDCRVSGKENHYNWKGGISFEPYPLGWTKTFKEQIRFRDRYTCQICGCSEVENSKRLCVHHIDYNKSNLSVDNLISLCRSCHIKTNYKREYWQEYFTKEATS